MVGKAKMKCGAGGSLTRLPTCKPTRCPKPRVKDGIVEPSVESVREGESYTVFCEAGFETIGEPVLECREGGKLSPAPQCSSKTKAQ